MGRPFCQMLKRRRSLIATGLETLAAMLWLDKPTGVANNHASGSLNSKFRARAVVASVDGESEEARCPSSSGALTFQTAILRDVITLSSRTVRPGRCASAAQDSKL